MNRKKVGIFGGTFDPPHNGHVLAAKAFFEKAELDSLVIIPTNIPPHKDKDTTVTQQDRIQMCELAFSSVPGTKVSGIEIDRGGKSYTYETLEELSSPECELYFLCGTDMFLTLEFWKNPERIFKLATICYIRRESDMDTAKSISEKKALYERKFGARVIGIDSDVVEISSTELRNMISDSAVSEKYISKDVLKYINDKGLYR